MLTKRMAVLGFVDKTYGTNMFCLTISSGQHSDYEQKRMPGKGFVDKTYAKTCYVYPRKLKVNLFCQSIKS